MPKLARISQMNKSPKAKEVLCTLFSGIYLAMMQSLEVA